MKYISFLIKPASSLCNMRCRYCFYYDVADHREVRSHGIMQEDTMQALIERALGLDGEADITFAFQGGEPLLAGLPFYEQFADAVKQLRQPKQNVRYAIQTNGCLLNAAWCSFFHKHNVLVGTFVDNMENASRWKKAGVKYLSYSVDTGIFYEASRDLSNKLKAIK